MIIATFQSVIFFKVSFTISDLYIAVLSMVKLF